MDKYLMNDTQKEFLQMNKQKKNLEKIRADN